MGLLTLTERKEMYIDINVSKYCCMDKYADCQKQARKKKTISHLLLLLNSISVFPDKLANFTFVLLQVNGPESITHWRLTLNILVSMVNILNSSPIPRRNIAKFCFASSNIKKVFLVIDRGRNASPTSFRMCSSKARPAMLIFHLKPTQPVVWCGVGYEELRPS